MECNKPTKKYPDGRTGTWTGYYAHRKVGEEACRSCAEAARSYVRKSAKKRYYEHPEENRLKLQRRKAERKKVRQRYYSAKQVTETHGTVCYLCQTPVDIDLPPGEDTSPVIGYVVPLRIENGPGDTLTNARWVHKRCNDRKRERKIGQCVLPFPPPKEMSFDG